MTMRTKNLWKKLRKTTNQKIKYWIELKAQICVISRINPIRKRETKKITRNSQIKGWSKPRTNWARVRLQCSIRSLTKVSLSTSWARSTSRSSRTSKDVRRCRLHQWSRTPRSAHKSNPRTWRYNTFRSSHKITPSLRIRTYCSARWRRRKRAARTTCISLSQAFMMASKSSHPLRTPTKKINLTQ